MKKIIALGLVLVSTPALVLAVNTIDGGTVSNTSFGNIIVTLVGYLNYIVPALVTLAVVYFIVGVVSFMTSNDEESKKKGRTKIINGLIGLFVIVAFWGIIAVVGNSFGIGNRTGGDVSPCVPTEENGMGVDC